MQRHPKSPIEQKFGSVLRHRRLELGLSQEELAFRADVDRTFVSMLERGLRMPSLGTILSLARALELTGAQMIQQLEQGEPLSTARKKPRD